MYKDDHTKSSQLSFYNVLRNSFGKASLTTIFTLTYFIPNYVLAEAYYWRDRGLTDAVSTSVEEACEIAYDKLKLLDSLIPNQDYTYFNYRTELSPRGLEGRCKMDRSDSATAIANVELRGSPSCRQGKIFDSSVGNCVEGPQACSTNPSLNNSVTPVLSNPVNVLTGGKSQQFSDLNVGDLNVIRSFKHSGESTSWSFNFQESLTLIKLNDKPIYIHQYMGRKDYIREVTPQCWRSAGSQCYKIEPGLDTHTLISSNQKKQFDEQGRIIKKSNLASEEVTNYIYSANAIQIEKNNHSIDVQLDADNKVISISNGADSITYQYADNGMIEHVIGVDQRDDYYLYGGAKNNLLIESGADGEMFARWDYDANNRVVLSEHAGGVDRYTFAYPASVGDGNTVVEVTNQLDKKTIFKFIEVAGANRLTEVEGLETPSCIGTTRGFTYHPDGNVASESDNKGNTTSYQYNTRNLESSRTEALGTPQERTITTEWHPTFNLRTKITEPGRETNFIYDAEGRLLSQSSNEAPPN